MKPFHAALRKVFPAKDSEVEQVLPALLEYLQNFYSSAFENIFATELVLREVVTNAIHHGSPNGGEVIIEISPCEESFSVRVFDSGPDFPLDSDYPPDGLQDHGRGLWILHNYASDIQLHKEPKYIEFSLTTKPINL